MKILILAAGYGTRLKEITKNKPKPLLEINGKTLVDHILDRFHGIDSIDEIIIVTNAKFYTDFITWSKKSKSEFPISIVNDMTTTPENRLGSIGDINFVFKERKLEDDVLVIGGDNLFDYNIDEFIHESKKHPDNVSIGLYDIKNLKDANQFGVVSVDKNNKMTSFEEKPENPKSTLIAMCFYYLPKKTLGLVDDYLVESQKSDRAGDYIKWLHEKFGAYGFIFTGTWYDIGSIEAYEEAKKKFH